MKLKFAGSMVCSLLLFQTARLSAQPPASDPQAGQQSPPAQTPTPGTPPTPKPEVQIPQTPAPSSKPAASEDDTGGNSFSIEPFYWLTKSSPLLRPGKGNSTTDAFPNLHSPGTSKYGEGIVVTIPTSRQTNLEFTYFLVKSQGNIVMPNTLNFFGNDFTSGDVVADNWLERTAKLSWNYLTWPYPSNGAKFRVKTLWEVQWAQVNSNFDAPTDVNAVTTLGSKQIIFPTLGVGIEYHPAKHLRLEVKASGFGIPGHADLWDAEGSAVFRFWHVEALVGDRVFHYKTSPQGDWYFSQTMDGPYIGLRFMAK